jgi:hypothetical protein
MLRFVLRQLDDGMEITAEPGRGSVRLRNPHRPWDDVILDLQCEPADTGVHAATSVRTLDGDGVVTWAASVVVTLDSGEDMRRLVAELTELVS